MKPKIGDVAKEAGVSISTVSRVINKNYPVKKETREKVEKAIKNLNFVPNPLAKSLVSRKTNTIGVLVPSISNTYFSVVINGIQDYFIENGFYILLCDTREDSNYEANMLKNLKDKYVDGIISIDPNTKNIKSGLYEEIKKETPLVLINGYDEGTKLSCVMNDQRNGTKEALEYLISLNHKNIAFIRGKKSHSYDIKEEVYKQIMLDNNLKLSSNNILVIEKGNSTETVDLAQEAFVSRMNMDTEKPTAFFCCNDWMAVGILNGAQQLNISVPKDLSVIGVDNIIISKIAMPKLTTLDQNMYLLGKTAAELLFKTIQEPSLNPVKIILNTELIIRNSTATINSI